MPKHHNKEANIVTITTDQSHSLISEHYMQLVVFLIYFLPRVMVEHICNGKLFRPSLNSPKFIFMLLCKE